MEVASQRMFRPASSARRAFAVAVVGMGCHACAVIDVNHSPPLDPETTWLLLPVVNLSETPQAGEKAEAILTTLIRAQGLPNFNVYEPISTDGGLPELDEQRRYHRALEKARVDGYVYGVTGSVVEWRYKSGLDGEPAIGISVRVVEVGTGKVVWSASGARSGWGQETLGGTAQKLLRDMVEKIRFTHSPL